MKVAFFDVHEFEREAFLKANQKTDFSFEFIPSILSSKTALLAQGCDAVCSFVNDHVDAECLEILRDIGINFVALRSAGFNHVDIKTAKKLNIQVVRVPGYSPHAVAEYTIGLYLTLNRNIHRAYTRVRDLNFSLNGLVGSDVNGKTVGILGTGRIGTIVAEIFHAFGCHVLAYDIQENLKLKSLERFQYVDLNTIYAKSDVISLHVPLNKNTEHILGTSAFDQMKKGVFIINTGRGGLIDTKALILGLKSGQIGAAALDVYEEEENVFFHDLSSGVLQDDQLARLLTFPNVLISSHQAFLTHEALKAIAETTLDSIRCYANNEALPKDRFIA